LGRKCIKSLIVYIKKTMWYF